MAAIPSHRVSRKIDFCGPVQPSVMMHHHHHHLHHNHQHNHLQNRKRGVHLLLRSGGSAGAGNPGSTFVVTKPTVMKPVGNSLVLSPKEPPPDTILLSPQQMTDRGIGVMRDQQQEKLANNNNNNNIDDYEEEEQQKKHHMQQLEEREEEMDECAAAMVLMRLSCSPRSPGWVTNSRELEGSSWSDRLSPSSTASSSGIASYPDGTPSPPLPKEYSPAELDDDFEDSPKEGTRTAYKCTWKGCDFLTLTCSVVENHVKDTHLGDEIDDLAFYYTEIDVPEENFFDVLHALEDGVGAKQKFVVGSVQERHLAETRDVLRGSGDSYVGFHASSAPTLSHMDMARPPHENPDLMSHSPSQRTTAVPISIPQRGISWHPYGGSPLSPHKYARHSPKPGTSPKMVLVSRSRRAESKKCRKVYGVDNRDLWCTQCKWKKACTRFQE